MRLPCLWTRGPAGQGAVGGGGRTCGGSAREEGGTGSVKVADGRRAEWAGLVEEAGIVQVFSHPRCPHKGLGCRTGLGGG